MERRFQKRRVLSNLSKIFYLEELTQIEWLIKKNKGRAYETKLKIRNIRLSFNRLFNFKRLPVVYITIYQEESEENISFGNYFLHWLEIEKIEKTLIEFSKFELSIEKIM